MLNDITINSNSSINEGTHRNNDLEMFELDMDSLNPSPISYNINDNIEKRIDDHIKKYMRWLYLILFGYFTERIIWRIVKGREFVKAYKYEAFIKFDCIIKFS